MDSPLLAGFNGDNFRANIVNTMIMGLPVDPAQRPTFHFRVTLSYPVGTKLDSTGKALDPRITPTEVTRTPVQVPVAVEYMTDTSNEETLAGTFWSDRVTLTVLDTQWELINEAIEVDLSGRRYLIQNSITMALGPVGVYQLFCFKKGVAE